MGKRYYSFHKEIGSLLYRLIYLGLLFLGIKFWGTSVLEGIVLYLLGAISFELVGFILRGIGIWKY